MRISLCVITGNEAPLIVRFLDSFAPVFDELSLVRAVGASQPDETAALAEDWCKKNGKAFVFSQYENGMGAEEWNHVDDFAAARNAAFSGGTGDWLLWADVDDLLFDYDGLRELLAHPAVGDLVRFPYDVVGTGKRPVRERAIRRTSFAAGNKWQFPVHENLLVRPGTSVSTHDAPVWVHQPKKIGVDNRRRNKQILSRALQHASAHYFYVAQEWFCEGNKYNATKFSKLALEFPDLDPSFRYETNLNLARLTDDTSEAIQYALAAHGIFPWCREAHAMLALSYIERNDPKRAVFWAERMDATPLPHESERPWTHEPKWYGWAGVDLLARAYRFAGNKAAAASVQNRLGQPTISLIHATRGRANKAGHTRNLWLSLAVNPERIQHVYCVDDDDTQSKKLASQFEHTVSMGKSCVAAWNDGCAIATGDLLVQLSDDWLPVPGWDAKLLDEVKRAGKTLDDPLVIAVSDGHRKDDLLCMAILTHARYVQQGYAMFSSEYESVFSDNEFAHRAWRDGVVIDARDRITFEHEHPAFGAAPMDATYAHNNAKERYEKGEATFRKRNPDAVKP
jgi:glycosyltransferase involved in cell wall biosynthesis